MGANGNGNGNRPRLTGAQLAELRRSAGITQVELCGLTGEPPVPVPYLSMYENGIRPLEDEMIGRLETALRQRLRDRKSRIAETLEKLARMV